MDALSESVVYMLRCANGGPVKIGTTKSLTQRVAALQTASAEGLAAIRTIPGTTITERWLHSHFEPGRIAGEWFSYHPDMLTIECPDEDFGEDTVLTAEFLPEVTENTLPATVSNFLRRTMGQETLATTKLARKLGISKRTAENYVYGRTAPNAAIMLRMLVAFPDLCAELLGQTVMHQQSARTIRALEAIEVARYELAQDLAMAGVKPR